ncbi:MAG: hypothetical protein HC789_15195 [Microcoleus sp. CSU_2_2]|nr:hypothetical protein [Microcoleus sp. SU_5_3]NJS11616.1 hypothetical protein [Microcoleus sp. CSU_2_2]
MAYSDFTLRKVKQSFGLTAVEGGRFLPEVEPIAPSSILAGLLEDAIPWAIAVGTEKAKPSRINNLIRVHCQLPTVHYQLSTYICVYPCLSALICGFPLNQKFMK